MKTRLINKIQYIIVLLAISATLLVSFWALYPYKPLIIHNNPITIANKTVYAGKTLIYKVDSCKNTNAVASVQRDFVNGLVFPTPVLLGVNPAGCRVLDVTMPIPSELPTGIYHLSITYTYRVNPIRQVLVKIKSESFKIINSEGF